MTIGISVAFRERLIATDGACGVALSGADPLALVDDALRAARAAAFAVRHPEEPDDPFLSYASELTVLDAGRGFTLDAAELTAYPEIADELIAALRYAVEASGLRSGTLVAGDESVASVPTRATAALSAIEAQVVEGARDAGLPSDLWAVAESDRPDGLRDCDLYRVRDRGAERLTTGHFIFGLAMTPTMTVVNELIPDEEADDGSTRLWALRGNELDVIPGLGNPKCGTFDIASNGALAWTSELPTGVANVATLLQLRRADGSVVLIDEGEATGYVDRGKYLWSPSLHDDGTLAYLSGNRRQANIVLRQPDGATQSWPLPRGANVRSLKLSANKLLAVALVDFEPGGVGVVSSSDHLIRVVPGWGLAHPGTRGRDLLIVNGAAGKDVTLARLWEQDSQLHRETLGDIPFRWVSLLAAGALNG